MSGAPPARRRGGRGGEVAGGDGAEMPEEVLDQALAGIAGVGPEARANMRAHWALLVAWNRRCNLTSILDPRQAAWRHYRDSLAAWPYLRGREVVDFGSGAGFPGLVLAIVDPRLRLTLVEPRRRRASFLVAAAARLGLAHVRVLEAKAEDLPPHPFDHAVTRATFSAPTFLPAARAWLRAEGTLLCHRAADAPIWGRRHTYLVEGPPPARLVRHLDEVAARERSG